MTPADQPLPLLDLVAVLLSTVIEGSLVSIYQLTGFLYWDLLSYSFRLIILLFNISIYWLAFAVENRVL